MVFAVMLALLTLGINLSDTPDTAEHAASQPASAQLSQVAAVH